MVYYASYFGQYGLMHFEVMSLGCKGIVKTGSVLIHLIVIVILDKLALDNEYA